MPRFASPTTRYVSIGAAAAALLALGLRSLTAVPWPAAALVSLSVATFGLYGYDKWRAGAGGFRVPENALHILALAGGSPGALLGQRVFRHKTSKQPFQTVFWLILAAQAALVGWWLIRGG